MAVLFAFFYGSPSVVAIHHRDTNINIEGATGNP